MVQQAVDGQKPMVSKVHEAFMSLLNCNSKTTSGEHVVFGQNLIANQFALIFVNFCEFDFPLYWQSQFRDLFSLFNQPGVDQKYSMSLLSK